MTRIPSVTSIETAIKLYYSKTELSNGDIRKLFGPLGTAKVASLKKLAQSKMSENKIPLWNSYCVNTEAAYESWGLSITDLEKRYTKLKRLFAGGEQ